MEGSFQAGKICHITVIEGDSGALALEDFYDIKGR
jgi:hypothetical protein